MQRRIIIAITPLCLALSLLGGCGDPCLDDGPAIGTCKNSQASGSETAGTATATASETSASAGSAEAGTAEAGDGDGAPGDGDGTPGDGDGTPGDGDGAAGDGDGDPCMNGMKDPSETDVDCGGDCVDQNPDNPNDIEGQCGEADLCDINLDCQAGICDDGMCNLCPDEMPPAFDPMDLGYNECQSCLLTNCCAAVIDCFANIEKCVCWFNCVENTGATQACMDECGNGNIGSINSCMNNSCKADANNLNCAVPP